MTTEKIRVLVVEDHQLVREGLRLLLDREEDIEVCGEADTGHMACNLASKLTPDVIIMDVELPEMDGLAATERIKEELPGAHILALTAHSDPEYIYGMLRAGAEGYVLKHMAARDLTSAIRAVRNGSSTLSPSIARKLINDIRQDVPYLHADDMLSKREKEILLLMARGATSKEIAEILCLSPKTVDNHRARITEKLQVRNRVEAVRKAVKLGILSHSQACIELEDLPEAG
ncbi:MAG: response regulator transcription factor [Chloroflexi bacterium]|nr:response regulator transcription factor [Chloroflexota bacterium]